MTDDAFIPLSSGDFIVAVLKSIGADIDARMVESITITALQGAPNVKIEMGLCAPRLFGIQTGGNAERETRAQVAEKLRRVSDFAVKLHEDSSSNDG